jgi:biotin carboxyl carrier protein
VRRAVALVASAALLALSACSDGAPVVATDDGVATPTSTSTTSTTAPATTTTVPPTTAAPAPTAPPPPPTTETPAPRSVPEQPYLPMTVVGPVTLTHPSAFVERIGFHESSHDGAQQQEPLPTAVAPTVLETRDRGTGSQSAADVVVEPSSEIRSPVTGTVIRGGTYTLYCDHTDEYLVIEPDARPGWEVKVLHVVGLTVGVGDRVEAGATTIAAHAHQLPFASQVDDLRAADPAWPHVHVEVVDPTVPDRPTGPGCP